MSAGTNPRSRKHIPVRTCVVCREKGDKRALTRLVRTPDGVVIDLTGKQNGRGAYLCQQMTCWQTAARSDILNKALKMTLSEQDRNRLLQAVPDAS